MSLSWRKRLSTHFLRTSTFYLSVHLIELKFVLCIWLFINWFQSISVIHCFRDILLGSSENWLKCDSFYVIDVEKQLRFKKFILLALTPELANFSTLDNLLYWRFLRLSPLVFLLFKLHLCLIVHALNRTTFFMRQQQFSSDQVTITISHHNRWNRNRHKRLTPTPCGSTTLFVTYVTPPWI